MNPKPHFRVCSDLDDTIKITNTQDKLVTFYRGLFRNSSFTGMAELYQEWTKAAQTPVSLHIVSSSPPVLRKKIERFLASNRFPPSEIFLRNWITQPSIRRYKTETIEALASRYPEPLILLGDDTEHDPEVIANFAKKYPKRVLAAYIRIVKGRKLAPGLTGFYTAFDIACAELIAGRLKPDQVAKIGQAIIDGKKKRRLIPKFSLLPPKNFHQHIPEGENLLQELWVKIQKHMQEISSKRKR